MIEYSEKINEKEFKDLLMSVPNYETTAKASLNQLKKAIDNSMFISVAKNKNKIVGIARVVGDHSLKGMLCDVIVLPEFQKQGIGTKLVKNIISSIENDLGKDEQFLLELCPAPDAIDFYIKLGFVYDETDMIGMGKRFIRN